MAEPISLEDIQGIDPATLAKLRQIGINTIEALAATSIRKITDKTNIGPDEAFQMVAKARELVHLKWVTAGELYGKRKSLLQCSADSKKIDAFLG